MWQAGQSERPELRAAVGPLHEFVVVMNQEAVPESTPARSLTQNEK